ncbi:MAG: UDP-glucose 4-epimerase GalE [Balneolaceae bacterium]|nr:UDP-glucose 4-epimerase GalE [Balneolaceae bacterium]
MSNHRKQTVLVTGAAGYIGSHTSLELLNQGYSVVAIDNLANGKVEALRRVEKITGKEVPFFNADLRDADTLKAIFEQHPIDAVIHFAGYKAVGESVEKPLLYYSNNVSASVTLMEAMEEHQAGNIVFSSSCTVYGKPDSVPVRETDELAPTNPYGRSKLMVERILEDSFQAIPSLSVSILRYFNPIGAHPSGRIGEDPTGIPNNLLPYVARVAAGQLDKLQVFGNDYNTHDGTGVRDYIHVVDLAKAHIAALEELWNNTSLLETYNLGTGQGYSVLDVVKTFEEVSGKEVPFEFADRRPGDVDKTFADPSKANKKLNWYAKKDLNEMCKDMWNWQIKNPDGYN